MALTYVAVEIDTYDTDLGQVVTRYLSNAGPLARLSGARPQYEPRLRTPIAVGSSIAVQNYGQSIRGQPNSGSIEFAVDAAIYSWFGANVRWISRAFRVYQGESPGGALEDLTLVYEGVVANLSVESTLCRLQTTDASFTLDKALIDDFYGPEALESLRGKPKPRLWGQAFSIAPVLEDEPTQLYRVSSGPLGAVTQLRVGGIPWLEVSSFPRAGQWSCNALAGTITLGSTPLGGEVRCDARTSDYASLTTGQLISQIVATAGGAVDATSIATLDAEFPSLVGYYVTTDPVNVLDVLDEITVGGGCYWNFSRTGNKVQAGVVAPPSTPTFALDTVNLASIARTQMLPPIWRIRVEYARNWAPASSFFGAVSADFQQLYSQSGKTTPPHSDESIRGVEPLAIDLPTIRSLVATAGDAVAIRDRLWNAWAVSRQLYDATAWIGYGDLALYDNASLDFDMFSGSCRVTSLVQAFGGGAPLQLQLWGLQMPGSAASFQATPDAQPGITSASMVHLGFAGSITPNTTGRIYYQISGSCLISGAGTGVAGQIQLRYGTGTAPVNAASPAGTALSAGQEIVTLNTGFIDVPFCVHGVATGLTTGTPYWFDITALTGGGTLTPEHVTMTAVEM